MTRVNEERREHVVPPALLKVVTLPYPLVQDGTLAKLVANMLDEPFASIVITKNSNASVSLLIDVERHYYEANPEMPVDDDGPKKPKTTRRRVQCRYCDEEFGNMTGHVKHKHPEHYEEFKNGGSDLRAVS
jgi:hypothetical protein